MNLDEAVRAHSAWKMKLSAYLRHPDASLKSIEVRSDCRCELGKWLHGDGRKLAAIPEYKTLLERHAHFHRAAADVVDMANSGKATSEATALGAESPYSAASREIVMAIMALQKRLKS